MNRYGLNRFQPASVGYIIGPSNGNNTSYQKMEAAAPFTRVRIWHFSFNPGLTTHWESCVAATETAADDTQANRYKSIVSGTAYNTYATPGFTRVTYNGGQTYGDMTDIGVKDSPNIRLAYCVSDWMSVSSIARADGGTLPLLLLRTHHDSTQYNGVSIVSDSSGTTPWVTWATASAETFFRHYTGTATASTDGVGTLTNMPSTSQVGATAYHTAVEFDYGVHTRSFAVVGDSITAGGGGQVYVFDAWGTRGIIPDSTTAKPRNLVNIGQSSQISTTFYQSFRDMITGGWIPTDVILAGFSPNDNAYSISNSTRLANLQTCIDVCKTIGARIYLTTGCPINGVGSTLTNWLDNNASIRTLCTNNGYILLDWARLLENSLDDGQWAAGNAQPDNTHPSITGIGLMAAELDSKIPDVNVIIAAAGGGNWTNGATWVGGVAPTAADDAVLDSTSGDVTIDNGGAVCRSLNCVDGPNGAYTGILTHNAASNLTIGDGTAGTGNVALKLSSTMTLTNGSTATSIMVFASTSAMQQSIDTGGKTFAKFSFTGVGGSYIVQSNLNGSNISFTNGTLDLNDFNTTLNSGFNASGAATRVLYMGNGTVTLNAVATPWSFTTTTNMTFYCEGSTIIYNDVTASAKVFQGGGLTYNRVNFTGGGAGTVTFGATGGGCIFAYPWQVVGGTKTFILASGTTHTFLSGTSFGNGTNVLTMYPSATTAGFKFLSRFNADYLNLTNITASELGIVPAYAGTHSTDNGGNTNWLFTQAPSALDGEFGNGAFGTGGFSGPFSGKF